MGKKTPQKNPKKKHSDFCRLLSALQLQTKYLYMYGFISHHLKYLFNIHTCSNTISPPEGKVN